MVHVRGFSFFFSFDFESTFIKVGESETRVRSGKVNLEGVLGLGVLQQPLLSSAVSSAPLAGTPWAPWTHGIHRSPWTLGE